MAKDPAFLFYPGDWLGGTMAFTFEEKGAYLELLILQFNQGYFTEAQAKHMLSICSEGVWNNIKNKFSKNGLGYYQKRLKEEIDKRHKYTESRKTNALGKKISDKTNVHSKKNKIAYAKHMENENENINDNENDNAINDNKLNFLKTLKEKFIFYYKKNKNLPYVWSMMDNKHLGYLIKKSKDLGFDTEQSLNFFDVLFNKATSIQDDKFLSGISVSFLNSQFNKYLNYIQNGRNKGSNKLTADERDRIAIEQITKYNEKLNAEVGS